MGGGSEEAVGHGSSVIHLKYVVGDTVISRNKMAAAIRSFPK